MTVIDDINLVFNEITRQIQTSGIFGAIGSIIAIIVILVVAGLVIIGLSRVLKKGREYVGASDHMGTYKIGVRNDQFLTGNVNKNKSFLIPDVFERMKRVAEYPEIKDGILALKELWEKKLLYAYDMRVFESFYEDKYELPSDDIIIISPIALDNPIISWQDTKGERSWTGSATDLFKRYPKNVFCSEYTKYHDVKDAHGNKKRVYIIAPYTEAMNEQMTANPDQIKIVKDVMHGKQAYINVIQLPNSEALARIAAILPSMNDIYKELEVAREELKSTKDQRDRYIKLTDDMNKEIDGYKARLKTHQMIGEDKPIVPLEPKTIIGVLLAGLIGGFAAKSISLMEVFARYQGIDMLLLVATTIISIAAIKMFEKRQVKEQRFGYEQAGSKR